MKITIRYESSWGNSFLSDFDHSEELGDVDGKVTKVSFSSNKGAMKNFPVKSKKGRVLFCGNEYRVVNDKKAEEVFNSNRQYVASVTELNKKDSTNYKIREISSDTVLGILSRLIGDRRPLYQIKKNYLYDNYFSDFSDKISFVNDKTVENDELVCIVNTTGSTSGFSGAINNAHPLFMLQECNDLWGMVSAFSSVLKNEKICFKDNRVQTLVNWLSNRPLTHRAASSPSDIADILQNTKATLVISAFEFQQLSNLLNLNQKPGKVLGKFINKGNDYEVDLSTFLVIFIREYISVMVSTGSSIASHLNNVGSIPGISDVGFTYKDFMCHFSSGVKKPIYNNPYVQTLKQKGIGEVKNMLKKRSGVLTINIDVDEEKAKEIKGMIDSAAVASFYVGKKGLGYVERIVL